MTDDTETLADLCAALRGAAERKRRAQEAAKGPLPPASAPRHEGKVAEREEPEN